jgi:hypothetical protein
MTPLRQGFAGQGPAENKAVFLSYPPSPRLRRAGASNGVQIGGWRE